MTTPFPRIPAGWYHACHVRDLRRGPVGISLGEARFVAFLGTSGNPAVLDARCAHMGADLSRGHVAGGVLHCPLHDWQYNGCGRCVRVPASNDIPPFATQQPYPCTELGGHVIFNPAPVAPFPAPFYDGVAPADLLPAEPFEMVVNTPWYMIGANAFDLQHFRIAHDRTLRDAPRVESPAPYARRITATYDVTGDSLRDRLTRRLSGPQVVMSVTVWGGTNILVTATFQRTTSYGMVFVRPLDAARTHLRTIVWVPRRRGAVARAVLDPIDAWVRRRFIRDFMMDDATRSDGVRYNPATLIDADAELARYFTWLAALWPNASAAQPRGTGNSGGQHDAGQGADGRRGGVADRAVDGAAAVGAGAGDAKLNPTGGGGAGDGGRPDAGDHAAPQRID